MVRILLALPFITVNWFLLLRHRPHLLTLTISDSHILDSDNGATLTVARGGDRWQCCHNTFQASALLT